MLSFRCPWLAALVGVLFLFPSPGLSQQVEIKSYVARAREYLDQGNDPLATAFARLAIKDNPENAYAHWLLGLLLSRARDREGAVDAWVRAAALKPEWPVPRQSLQAALREAAPRWLSPEAMASLPGETTGIEIRLRSEGLVSPRVARCQVYAPPPEAPGLPQTDPKYGWEFTFHTYTYTRAPDAPRWDRRFSIHFDRREDAALARRVATLLGQLAAMADERLGPRSASAPAESHLWLSRRGAAGGEEWRGNLYLFETGRSRSAGEWVREVAHEFGHIAIPGTRHYTDPEPMGNGYLGERLLPLWLFDAGNARVWDGEVSLEEYVRTRVLPAAGVFLNAGPEAAARSDRGRRGMEFTIGLVLALELAHEADLIGPILRREVGSTADNLLTAYRDRIRTQSPPGSTIRGRALVPSRSEGEATADGATGRRLAYRVFVPAGEWRLTLEGEGIGGARARIGTEALDRSGGGFRWRAATSGWQLLELSAAEPLTLRQIRLAAARESGSGTGP